MNTILIVILVCMIVFPIILYIVQKDNLKHYKLNGRSEEEIEAWIKTRSWFTDFYLAIQKDLLDEYRDDNNVVKVDDVALKKIEEKVAEIICGEYGTKTISAAFSWSNSKEGFDYWAKREYQFLKWYYGQWVDFHLFK